MAAILGLFARPLGPVSLLLAGLFFCVGASACARVGGWTRGVQPHNLNHQLITGAIMRIIGGLGVALALVASQASAADLGVAARPIEPAPGWQGLYLGAHGGGAWDAAGADISSNGWLAGGQVGFSARWGNIVAGLVGDVSAADYGATATVLAPPVTITGTTQTDLFATMRAKIGVAAGPALIYGTGGLIVANHKYSLTALPAARTFADTKLHTGWTIGGGLEYALAPAWSVFGEYLYARLGSQTYTLDGVSFDSGEGQVHLVRGGVSYWFR